METENGPLVVSVNKSNFENEAKMLVDLTNCEQGKFEQFVFSLLTENHSKKITIDCDLAREEPNATILIAWSKGYEKEADKVISHITTVCKHLCE